MKEREPFRETFRSKGGMLKSAPFKDDPHYHGGRIPKPDIDGDVVLKPNIVMLLPRIIMWAIIFYIFRGEAEIGPNGSKFLFEGLVILDMIFAIPKFFFERTILDFDGMERTFLGHGKFFKWEEFHKMERDPLGLTFRVKPGWGVWRDEFNFTISWLYYSLSDIARVREFFPTYSGPAEDNGHGHDNLRNLKA
jgi:hypothetical protein